MSWDCHRAGDTEAPRALTVSGALAVSAAWGAATRLATDGGGAFFFSGFGSSFSGSFSTTGRRSGRGTATSEGGSSGRGSISGRVSATGVSTGGGGSTGGGVSSGSGVSISSIGSGRSRLSAI